MSEEYIKIFGSGKEIGASSFLLSTGGSRILLDCGMNPKKEGSVALPLIDFSDGLPDVGLITHAHLDHIGALPLLYSQIQFWASKSTKSIARVMLGDSANIQKRRFSDNPELYESPLYNERDVRKAVRSIRTFSRSGQLQIRGKIIIHSFSAGHILGARSFYIETPKKNILYTGDISLTDQFTVSRADIHNLDVDILIIEGTLGSEENLLLQRSEQIELFAEGLEKILKKKESVLCPTFALGKTQELLSICDFLMHKKKIPPVPIVINGMGVKITNIYRHFLANRMPFYKPVEILSMSRQELAGLLQISPAIFLFTSGMMIENTPSAVLASKILPQEKNAIFFVGYLASETPGYNVLTCTENSTIKLQDNMDPVEKINPNISNFRFTSHSNRMQLLELIDNISPSKIILIHGEEEALKRIKSNLVNNYDVIIPDIGEKINI